MTWYVSYRVSRWYREILAIGTTYCNNNDSETLRRRYKGGIAVLAHVHPTSKQARPLTHGIASSASAKDVKMGSLISMSWNCLMRLMTRLRERLTAARLLIYFTRGPA